MKFRERIGAVLFCFGTVMATSKGYSQENGGLLSASVTNGTPVVPRSMFTQTWTFENTGTTTWTAGPNGYTLDMVGLDSLGAIPLDTNTAGGTYHFPRAAINSGKNVAPGGTASFSMDFIAPEAQGSYTDSFQLNGTNWFGPTVTVQVAVEPGGNTNVFDRSRTVSFANNYAAYYCPDGYFWTNGSDWSTVTPDTFTPVPSGAGVDGGVGDDCAHFVSYCIGSGPYVRGGGISIPSRASPTYGEPAATRIVVNCLLDPGYAVEVPSLKQLEPGDVIGWNWEGDTNINDLDHVTLYEGNNLIASHAISAEDVGPTYFQSSGYVWHLIHILDYPTLWTSRSGKQMTFSWTTNWVKYALYSAPNVNGPWTKITSTISKTGDTNKTTLTLPSTGSVYYRLEMP
ncbi:MAG TPA: NBR1-Ig-like domain-containing protein [Alphaproteobacteria bacterium]|nr:NBR1-Ig-like domain-containing protein [Alphaproteobacteria bacterium]